MNRFSVECQDSPIKITAMEQNSTKLESYVAQKYSLPICACQRLAVRAYSKGTKRTEFKVRKILPLLFLKQNVSLQNLSLPPFKKNSLQNLSLLRVADPIDRVG